MANIKARKNKDGIITSYTIRVPRGYDSDGNRLKDFIRSYPDKKRGESIPSNWSQKKVQKEVERVATLFEEECLAGGVSVEKITFDEYARKYIHTQSVTGKHKNNTSINYEYYLTRINDVSLNGIGYMLIGDIKTPHINKFYTTLLECAVNQNNGKPLSSTTVRRYHAFISAVMSFACREGIIQNNPCERAERIELKKKEASVISEENLPLVIKCMETYDLRMRIIFYTMLTTGLRVGEALGVKYCDINFENGITHISNNVQYAKNYKTGEYQLYIETLKNGEDKDVIFPPYLLSLIKEKAEQEKLLNLNNDYFVSHKDGDVNTPIYPSTVRKALRQYNKRGIITQTVSIEYFDHRTKQNKVIEYRQNEPIHFVRLVDDQKYKIQIGGVEDNNYCYLDKKYVRTVPEELKPHKFRHTCASVLFFQNLDVVTVSKLLGHKQVSTTMNTYAHIIKKVDERPAQIFDAILKQNSI